MGKKLSDHMSMNDKRAEWASIAIKSFADATGLKMGPDENYTIVSDLFADLIHWCARTKVDMVSALRGGIRNAKAEVNGDDIDDSETRKAVKARAQKILKEMPL